MGHIGDSSVTLDYVFTDDTGETVGTSRSVHVSVDKVSMKRIPLPGKVRKALEQFREG